MGTYSPQDYVVYIGILLLVMWILRKYFFSRVPVDREFVYAIAPYVLVGVFIRVMVDARVFEENQLWSITPGVYLLTAAIAILAIAAGFVLKAKLKVPYWYAPFTVGAAIAIPLAYILLAAPKHPERLPEPLLMAAAITAAVYFLSKPLKVPVYRTPENVAIIFAHLLDGCATYIAYNRYGYGEEHLLPQFLINMVGDNAFVMVPAKLALILTVVYFIDKWRAEEKEDETLYRMVKILLFILGIGPGIRDLLLPVVL